MSDLDQALHLAREGAGYRVRYAIADVAAFVTPGGALDRAVRDRALTIYCPDERVGLHPAVLSEGAASLLPDQDRPAVVWDLLLDADGEPRSTSVRRAVVRSRAQLDYVGQQAALDGGTAAPEIALLAEVGALRARLERERGGVSLGRPEQEVVPVPGGWSLTFRAPAPVEEHNAQISLLTGMTAARMMLDAGIGVLRTMPAAGADDLPARDLLELFAFVRPAKFCLPTPRGLCEVLDLKVPTTPEEEVADLKRIVASMRRACDAAGVALVTGDTKVVDRGKGDGVFITTAGVGLVADGRSLSIRNARPGDRILVSGTLGDHGIAIMSVREGLAFVRSKPVILGAFAIDIDQKDLGGNHNIKPAVDVRLRVTSADSGGHSGYAGNPKAPFRR